MAGTTTIMFTDIELSSDLLAARGDDGYAELFSNHVALLRSEIERQGGRISKLLGDGLLALFESSYAGVKAAEAVQQAVDRANRRDTGSAVGLRVGVAVGEVVEGSDDIFGTAMVLARRLCDAAAPGQILVSEVVRALVGGRSDVAFEQLGLRVLEGFAEPVVTVAVLWDPLPDERRLRVVLADDAPLIRSGLIRLLADAGFVVTADVGDAEALLATVDAAPPDLVVTDIRMPPTNTDEGLRAAATIRSRHPDVAVLVLSQHVEGRAAAALLDGRPAGIGYLLKERVSDVGEFASACRTVAAGGSVIDPVVAQQLVRRRQHDQRMARLTDRERDVLGLMAEGRSNQAIADALVVGARTVETYIASIFQKLDLDETPEGNRRVQAVLHWLRSS